jgi:hypothetical protein
MKSLRIIAIAFLAVGIVSLAWNSGYRKGDKNASERESKAWEALLASGRLNGITDGMHRWARSLSITQAGYIADDYQSGYEHFLEACAKVPENSRASWLMDNHTNGKMKPDEFRSILLEYQNQAEQGSTGQPATRSESDSEGGDKPQPEAEGRTR